MSGGNRRLHVDQLGPSAITAARALLGAVMVRQDASGTHRARIVEVEAYRQDDPASHAFGGLRRRNATMFGPPGMAYVYRSYGVHWCLNVVAEPPGTGAGVLVRAARLLTDPTVIRRRRKVDDHDHLLRGPGCLTQGLDIDQARHDGLAVCEQPAVSPRASGDGRNKGLWLEIDGQWPVADAAIVAGPRVGVTQAADVAWRWWVNDDPAVSKYRRSPRASKPLSCHPGD